jgi:phosphopantetheinyl transferase
VVTAADVRVYWVDARTVGTPDIEALVTDEDRERLEAIAHARRRREYLVGRALLRFSLERWTGRPARSHRLIAEPGGKPACVDGPAISLSHADELVVCAIASAREVGVDVQSDVERRHTDDIARQYFSAEERAWLETAPAGSFYMLWVLKEAYLKLLGCGLEGGLDSLECRVQPPLIEAKAAYPADFALGSIGNAFIAVATAQERRERGGGEPPALSFEHWSCGSTVEQRSIRLIAQSA